MAGRPLQARRTSPPGFRPTGRGLANKLPNFTADTTLATGVLVNQARAKKDGYLWRMPVFIEGVQTGYHLAGDYGQTSSSRTFYPKNYSQDPITISVVVANHFEYDKLVHFVRQHHWDALDTFVNDPNDGRGGGPKAVLFKMFSYYVQSGRNRKGERIWREIYGGIPGTSDSQQVSNGAYVAGYITGIQAGAQKFQYMRRADIDLKVSEDFLADKPKIRALTDKVLESNYVAGLTTNLYGRKNGHVVPPVILNDQGQLVQGNAPTDPTDTMWHNAKLDQLIHEGV